MGLALRLNLFRDVDAPDVYAALASFYEQRGAAMLPERTIGVDVALVGFSVEFAAPVWRSFRPSYGDSGR